MTGIILYGSFELAPYSKKYMKILDDAGEKYDLVGWRREEEAEYFGDNVFIYEGKAAKRFSSVLSKALPALGYRNYVKKLIRRRKYNKLIILTTQTAVILSDLLLLRYRKRYIFDYRDKSYEYIKLYGMLINSIIKRSVDTVISSPWFADVLTDKKDYILVHNFQDEFLPFMKSECRKKPIGEKIIIGYVGTLRSYEYHKQLSDMFGNDERFEFHTYGCGDDADRLSEYAKKYNNVFFYGAYKERDKYDIIDGFDMMCYNYPYSFVNDGAVANKYYDSLIMKKPMFVNPKTTIGRFIEAEGMGVGITEGEAAAADKIYSWYVNDFDADRFSERCSFYMNKYIDDNKKFSEKICKGLLDGKG